MIFASGTGFGPPGRLAGTVRAVTPTDVQHLRRCIELARSARARGDEPFGSLLVGPDGTVLAEHLNAVVTARDCTAHPELTLARWAFANLDADARAASTIYTSTEHCAMCAGAHYWAGVGRLVFAFSSEQLTALVPPGAPTLNLSTREVFSRGTRPIAVEGPCAELAEESQALFADLWG
jgi:tRNA(Arg) A34 adenosine deaminase TadA